MTQQKSHEAWVAAAVRELRAAENWTGRIHVHKLFAVTSLLSLAEVPFDFELYYYGPYSRELDCVMGDMERDGILERAYPRPGYGPQYGAISCPELDPQSVATIRRVACVFGKRDSKALELISTCLWLIHREAFSADDKVVERVHELKPKYSPEEIRENLVEARQIEKELCAA